MPLFDELSQRVRDLAFTRWGQIPNARVLPDAGDLTFGNTGERIEACILYADIHRSTEMVDSLPDTMAAEYYKAFLYCAGRIIKSRDGSIQAYDGDRVMGVFVGGRKEENAVLAAFRILYAVQEIINPTFKGASLLGYREIRHTVGIDVGPVLVAKAGVRNDKDLVWIGPAANYAAKLNSFEGLDISYATRITQGVYEVLPDYLLVHQEKVVWDGPYTDVGKRQHYRSKYYQEF
mgnify:CR=1 FL=1